MGEKKTYLPIVFPTWHPRRGDSARAGPPVDSTRQRRPVPGAGASKHWRSPRRWTSEGWRSRAWTNPRAPGESRTGPIQEWRIHRFYMDPGGLIHWILSWKVKHRRFLGCWYMVLSFSYANFEEKPWEDTRDTVPMDISIESIVRSGGMLACESHLGSVVYNPYIYICCFLSHIINPEGIFHIKLVVFDPFTQWGAQPSSCLRFVCWEIMGE